MASPIWGIVVVALLLLTAAVTLSSPGAVTAAGTDLDLFLAQYPNTVNTDLDNCDTCHTNNRPELNPYGQDYRAQGRTMAALTQIETIDSDGDGVINIVEIDTAVEPGNDALTPLPVFIPLVER